jgi:predicted transcriptional regulator
MFSRASSTIIRRAVVSPPAPLLSHYNRFLISRSLVSVQEALTAEDARSVSGYSSIDYTINENATVYDAVQRFAAYNIGCLVVTNDAGEFHYIYIFCI